MKWTNLTLRDERILVEEVYSFASELMYEFLNSTNYLFFMNFLNCVAQRTWNVVAVMVF